MDACKQDDLFIFDEDGSFQIDEGASKCDDSDPQIMVTGSWEFNFDESQLVLYNPEETTPLENLSISASKLSFTTDLEGEYLTHTVTYTMIPN